MRSFAMFMLGLVLGGVLGASSLLWGLDAVGYVTISVATKGNECLCSSVCPCPDSCPCPTLPAKVPAVVPEKPIGEEKPVGDVGATE